MQININSLFTIKQSIKIKIHQIVRIVNINFAYLNFYY